ncbi:brefeldin A-inhibited guanine nucleotide-exchange protein 3-like protein, partial [Leptotrombidium deliense]
SGITKIKSNRKQNYLNETLDTQGFGRGSESLTESTNDKIFSDPDLLVKISFLCVGKEGENNYSLFKIFMDSVKECSYSDDHHIVNQSVLCVVALLKTFESIMLGLGLDDPFIVDSFMKLSETQESIDCLNYEEQHPIMLKRGSSNLMRKDFKDFQINSYKSKLGEILDSSSSLSSSTSSLSSVSESHNNDNESSGKHSEDDKCVENNKNGLYESNTQEAESILSTIKSLHCNDEDSEYNTQKPTVFADEDIVALKERENARQFFFSLKTRLRSLPNLRTTVEIDDEFQKFASDFCKDVWEKQINNISDNKCDNGGNQCIIINGDGIYLAIYSGLSLNLRLLSENYYSDSKNTKIKVTEQEFVNEIQKSGVLVYLSATWLREFYQMILSESLLELSDSVRQESTCLINLITDLGCQNYSHRGSHELINFKKMLQSSSQVAFNDTPKTEAGKILVKILLRRFWTSISTILSSLFINDVDVNSTQSILTSMLTDNQKDCLEKRETLIQCLEALQITSRTCISLGLQSKCNGIFDMLTKSIVNPFIDETGKRKETESDILPCLHTSQVLSLQSILLSALEVSSHCLPCWEFVFICCNYVINLEYLHFSKRKVTKESKLTLSSVLKLKKQVKDDLDDTFSELQAGNSLLGPQTEKDITECLNDIIQNNVSSGSTKHGGNDKLLREKNFERAVECLAFLVDKLFTDAACRLNLESLLGFLRALISNSSRELHYRSKNVSLAKSILFNRFCDVMLKITRSGRPLIHVMKCWSVAYPHFVEAACYKSDISVCKSSVSTINDIVTMALSTYTELQFFHFNEALFKPYESLLLLELCETDIQEMVISSICGFVEGYSEELRSGWRSLFAALRGIRLPNIPFGNHAVDAYELEMERVRQLRVILDIFEAFLGKNNLDTFANAAVDCLLCLLQLLKDPSIEETQNTSNGNKFTSEPITQSHYSVDLCLVSLKYLHQFESLLRSMYKMPACPMFSCNRSISTCSEPKIIDIPLFFNNELKFKVPLLLYDIDRAVKILHVWYLLLDGLMNSITTCPHQHQTKAIEMSLSMLGTLRLIPGKEFAVYCMNHIALPLLQRWSHSLSLVAETQPTLHLNNFKHFCGLLSHLVVEHLKLTPFAETDFGLDLMFVQTISIFIEISETSKHLVASNLSLACLRHIILESYKYLSTSMWTSLCSCFRICSKLHLKSITEIIDAFPNKTINFYDDLCNVRIITKRQNAKTFEEPELIVRGCVHQVFLLDSQRLFANETKHEEGDNRCFLLQITREEESTDISFCKLVRELLSHLSLITTVSEILVSDLPHALPNVSCLKSKSISNTPFLSTFPTEIMNEMLLLLSDCARTYQEFDARPGLKFLIQKISHIEIPANLYQQSALCFSVQFLVYFFFCTQTCNIELESKLKSIFEKTCEDYTDFIMQTERNDSKLDEMCQKPIFFLPQIAEFNDIIATNDSTSNEESESTMKIYKIVDEKRIEELTNEYKKWKSQHSPIPPVFAEKVSRKKELPKKFYSTDTVSSVEKANEICLMRDTEAYLCLWTQILQSVLELHLALPHETFQRMVPIFEPGVELLVMYTSSKELKSVLTLWIRKVAFKEE